MSLLIVLVVLGFVWPIRPSRTYRPTRPIESWRRRGYARDRRYNPNGWHQATDFDIATNDELVQLPYRSRIVWKGIYGDLGKVLEVLILEGPHRGRYMRFCHLRSYTDRPIGQTLGRGFAVAHADNTGRSSGSHLHIEIGRYRLRSARFPKYNFYPQAIDAYNKRRWVA